MNQSRTTLIAVDEDPPLRMRIRGLAGAGEATCLVQTGSGMV
jgi:hypothetical protein